ncbi:hypothetical protein HFK74_19475|uniref:hypothetical protein n=1 Tax=Pseudomonas sp. SbOxS1 TaxID=2723884 RepID=UPI0015D29363|nr:hypothetical protein [Pseudomonas sp. SbOxS1]NYU04878.1 hypothetical protein [Pseudomonas sp. SbOxS1]
MPLTIATHIRLEPRPHERNLEAGIAAAVHDPLWFLARQWQMGEHQGENASSPTWVSYGLSSQGISAADPRFDPMVIPAEAIVESEIDDWWTMGRRVRIGRRFEDHPAVDNVRKLMFLKPPPPYEYFEGQPDGLMIWLGRAGLGIADSEFGVDIPIDSASAWDSAYLLYQQSEQTAFTADQQRLMVQRHHGGLMDWYSVDAITQAGQAVPEPEACEAIPTALNYPGAPSTRWWEIENAEVDMGGYAPDSAHTPTALLTDLIFSHSDDWFLFPVMAQAGNVVTVESIEVRDAFGRTYGSQDKDEAGNPLWKGLHPPQGWTLFKVDGTTPEDAGLASQNLILWHVAELPLESAPLERVQFGLDEESNLLWAVERTVDGREVELREIDAPDSLRFNDGKPSGDACNAREYAYVPAQGIVPHWHPYTLNEEVEGGQRRLVQRHLLDFSRQEPVTMPAPEAAVLQADKNDHPHHIAPLAIPVNGIEVERRWMLARDMNGQPVLWIQRCRRSLLSPLARRLRFDVMEEANE